MHYFDLAYVFLYLSNNSHRVHGQRNSRLCRTSIDAIRTAVPSCEANQLTLQSINTSTPLENFQLSVPPVVSEPDLGKTCTIALLRHVRIAENQAEHWDRIRLINVYQTFGNSWGKPAVTAYTPPAHEKCGSTDDWSNIVLNYTATSNGTQYDRLSSVYLNHIEILRTSTSEPTRGAGIYWTALKDVTSYARLFGQQGRVILDLGNGLDYGNSLDGEFDVTLSVTFHQGKAKRLHPDSILPISNLENALPNYFSIEEDGKPASQWVSLPSVSVLAGRSRNSRRVFEVPKLEAPKLRYFQYLSTNEHGQARYTQQSGVNKEQGHTYLTHSEDFLQTAERAIVEIHASGNAREEFWYTNIPDSLQDTYPDMLAKGPFREVSLSIDGMIAGYAFPYPVIFSGGIVPSAWRPMIAFGAYDQPTYEIDITALLPLFAGKTVKFSLQVQGQGDSFKRNVYGNWFVSGNVKVWKGERDTQGKLLEYNNPPLHEQTVIHIGDIKKNDSMSLSTARRKFKIVSEVNGQVATFRQDLQFVNRQKITTEGRNQHVEQMITTESVGQLDSRTNVYDKLSFPLSVTSDYSSDSHFGASIQLGYHRNSSFSQMEVVQKASGDVFLNEIGRVVNGTGHSQGRLTYAEESGRRYERSVRTKDLDVLKDEEKEWRWAL